MIRLRVRQYAEDETLEQIMQLPRLNVETQEFDRPYRHRWYYRRRPRRAARLPPEVAPFSLRELGLTPDEIEALGLGDME